ncbi:preprotein translocase subunit SecA [Roseimaritima sediminicola]|uniref:preprotein translocase subunit SecA n=1 Tax=Roseimaritima sediminicola TaxID=2662066 RepID=UPI0012983B64|nr:helicase-related protein [Roseimaritima sediminicola]
MIAATPKPSPPKPSSPQPAAAPRTELARQAHAMASRMDATPLRSHFDALRVAVLRGARPDEDEVLVAALALMASALRRCCGITPYVVQLHAAVVMARGGVAEMATGEGKTYSVALAAAALATASRGVHVATANDYLAARDCESLTDAFALLGLRAALVEPALDEPQKRSAYAADVVYGTANTLAFDYLHDVVARRQWRQGPLGRGPAAVRLNRRRFAVLIDEIDHILIDEASTPLILSMAASPTPDPVTVELHRQAAEIADGLVEGVDWTAAETGFHVDLTAEGRRRAAQMPPQGCQGTERLKRPWSEYVQRAVEALHRVRRDVDYVVREGEVQIVDPATGRINPDRRWQNGLHQAVEHREGLTLSAETASTAQITRWRFFDRYRRLAGCSGTAWDARGELLRVYGLQTTRIPLRCPSAAEELPTCCCVDTATKYEAITDEVKRMHREGRPVLLGTENIQQSQQLAEHLIENGLTVQVLNGVQPAEEADVVAAAGAAGAITIATDLAGRGTDIRLDDDVVARGGLHVIVVSPRSSPRLDRQLVGRAARQGQPGSHRTYISLEDTLIRTHAPYTRHVQSLSQAAAAAAARAQRRAVHARTVLAQRDRARDSLVG